MWRMKVGSVKGKSISENEKRVIHHFEVKGELRGFTEGKKQVFNAKVAHIKIFEIVNQA